MWTPTRCHPSNDNFRRGRSCLPLHQLTPALFLVFLVALPSNAQPLDLKNVVLLEDNGNDFTDLELIPSYKGQQPDGRLESEGLHIAFLSKDLTNERSPMYHEFDSSRDKRSGRRFPVRRNGRDIPLGSHPVMESVEPASGNALQDLNQIRRAIAAWDAKLKWFAEKFADHPEALRANPVWNKLLRIRNTLIQLAAAEEMRQMGLDETRM